MKCGGIGECSRHRVHDFVAPLTVAAVGRSVPRVDLFLLAGRGKEISFSRCPRHPSFATPLSKGPHEGGGAPTGADPLRWVPARRACGPHLAGAARVCEARSPLGAPPRLSSQGVHWRLGPGRASRDAVRRRYLRLCIALKPSTWHAGLSTCRRGRCPDRPGTVCETVRGNRTRSALQIASGKRPSASERRHFYTIHDISQCVVSVKGIKD
jgi:hypothetical protein